MAGVTYYADRGFITINGVEKANVKDISWTIDESITKANTMSRDRRSAGYKKGNRSVTGSMTLEVPDQAAEIDLSFLYGDDIDVVAQLGTNGERWSIIGLVQTNQGFNASVGETSKTIAFEAIDATNENGPAVNSELGL